MSSEIARYEPDPDLPGWMIWSPNEKGRFHDSLGPVRVRSEGERIARVRMWPERRHSNLFDAAHGGTVLGFVDVALFAGLRSCGLVFAAAATTVDISVQFLARAPIGEPLDAVVELLRETGRLVFLRGIVEQSHGSVAAFSATVRKPSQPK